MKLLCELLFLLLVLKIELLFLPIVLKIELLFLPIVLKIELGALLLALASLQKVVQNSHKDGGSRTHYSGGHGGGN
jgi:hypothetical protein